MEVGQSLVQTFTVREQDAAVAMGSGSLQVLATPALVAFMENTAMKLVACENPEGSTTVGTEMNVKHLKASAIGTKVTVKATLYFIDGKKRAFSIEAKDENGNVIGTAEHQRFVVDIERFMSKLKR